jgi:ribose transport system ATP-binding protein
MTIEFRGVGKTYEGTAALIDFSHSFATGQVHALMGRNGSGKSTAIKILAGAVLPTTGELVLDGRRMNLASPADAFASGIVTVHQELSLVPSLSVAENVFLGRLPRRAGLIDWSRLNRQCTALLQAMHLNIKPGRPVGTLSLGQQQMVEIVKAMSYSPRVMILDEPTSALASLEVGLLFALVRRLQAQGVTIIYITHRLNELFEIADTCTVIRDGRLIGSVNIPEVNAEQIVEMMFGPVARAVRPPRRIAKREAPILSVRGLTRRGSFEDISFDLFPGEVLGMAGLLGAGRTEVLRAIFGADQWESGTIRVDGVQIDDPTPRRMKAAGVGYTPENRKEVGLVQAASVHDNLLLASLGKVAGPRLTSRVREAPVVRRLVRDLGIKVADPMLPVATLSGGNQQKVVIGNWLNTTPRVMFFDEPSRGVDIVAKQQVFEIMWRQADEGLAAVFVSTELEELLEVCDRIIVMRHGRLVTEVEPQTTNLTTLYSLCMEGVPP